MKARRLAASSMVAACALTAFLAAQAPSSSSQQDLAVELAGRIASAVAPFDEVRLLRPDPGSANAEDEAAVVSVVAEQLRSLGLSLVSRVEGAATVRVVCSQNLRDRVCAAEVLKGDSRESVAASRPRAISPAARPASRLVTLEVRPVFSQRERILDLAEIGDRLLVFDVAGFHLYRRTDAGWKAAANVALSSPPAWPRDPRGRLTPDGDVVEAFMPGMTCRCTLEPLNADCRSSQNVSWPVGVANSTLAPSANYFTSPGAPAFFTAARLGTQADADWLLAGVDGRLHLIGPRFEARRTLPAVGDDIAAVETSCGSGRQIIAAESDADDGAQSLRAYEMAGSRLVPLTPSVHVPGRITALWETPAKTSALVVAFDDDLDRYEAFHASLACLR